jgi:nuclear pore complex protein Nup155
LSTKLGLFPEIHRAWAAVDNALYIWDYTQQNPELAGSDDFSANIVAVKLAKPKKDTFRGDVNYVLLVATTKEMHIFGVASSTSPQGVTSVELYQTDMKISMSNLATECIACCPTTGRIFVGCSNSNAIYEMQYQKEERWFWSKCGKVNQTFPALLSTQIVSEAFSYAKDTYAYATSGINQEYSIQIEIDESRQLLYVLSNKSNIRVFHMLPESDYRFFRLISDGSLKPVISKTKQNLMSDIAHIVQRSTLLKNDLQIVSISPVAKSESSRIALVAITSLGIRLYLSVTSGARFFPSSDDVEPPSSMQIHHIKFPPSLQGSSKLTPRSGTITNGAISSDGQSLLSIGASRVDTDSQALKGTTFAARYSPGSQFFLISPTPDTFRLFISAPDTGRLPAVRPDIGPIQKFFEYGMGSSTSSGRAIDIGLTTPPFSAANTPTGFGNELALQFDRAPIEVAVLTNTGVQIYRRRRLVDSFAALLRTTTTEEDFESNVNQFRQHYSRIETCASALAVACGQATDAGSDTARPNVISNPEVIELARRTFIELGGKPDNVDIVGDNQSQVGNIRISARTNALVLYTSRLVRSLWKKPILGSVNIAGVIKYTGSTIPVPKLQKISQDLTNLKEFLDSNKSFITGLSGPEELSRAASVDEQVTVQAEHRALTGQIQTLSNMIEAIAFLTQLFDQPFAEILASLPADIRDDFGRLTYDMLFTSSRGKLLAKEVVKAIVNRSIEAGSSVESVADSLRRRCGSFCSQADVVTFKAQEKLQKSMDAGTETANGRSLLNESLKLFKQVADSFTAQYLEAVVLQYLGMSFYAGKSTVERGLSNVSRSYQPLPGSSK